MNDWTMHDDDPRDDDLEAECYAELTREAEQERRYREALEQERLHAEVRQRF